jgi:hypothetical protein
MTSVRLIPRLRADLRAGCVRVWSKQWLRFMLLALIGFVVRLPALLFLDSYSAHYRPVQNLSFIVDHFFSNGDLAALIPFLRGR